MKNNTFPTNSRQNQRLTVRPVEGADLAGVVERLCQACGEGDGLTRKNPLGQPLPSLEAIAEIVETLRSVLFPGYFGDSEVYQDSLHFHIGATLDRLQHAICEQIRRGLCFTCVGDENCAECETRAQAVTKSFFNRLPDVRRVLATDVKAAFAGDPAATSEGLAIFCYPGLMAITNYRLAHELHRLGVPLIPRIITEHAHSLTGIDIHPGARIGESFFIDHGTGVVIGETCVIGDRVRLYQGVTLGAKSVPRDGLGPSLRGVARHPLVEDDVIIYSGATILGRVTIGRGSVIGGNVWLTHSVPAGSAVTQAQYLEEHFEAGAGI